MVKLLNNKILKKIDEIILVIEESDEYQKYLCLKEQMQKDNNLIKLINEVKVLQKDVVHHLEKKELLNQKITELNNYPLYREYSNVLFELNNTYSLLETMINNYFNNVMN